MNDSQNLSSACAPSIDDIIAYENGLLDEDETLDLFQRLVDSGLAWELQGHYGRTAMALIEEGLITLR
jgi:hypothetical protein